MIRTKFNTQFVRVFIQYTMIRPQQNYNILFTSDGSHTVARTDQLHLFHSKHGAIQESQHIFITHGLEYFRNLHRKLQVINVLEIGFGTGLNALLSLLAQPRLNAVIHYTAIDKHPLPQSVIQRLNHSTLLELNNETKRYYLSWFDEMRYPIRNLPFFDFSLSVHHLDYLEYDTANTYDLIFYDAFGPDENPEMWSDTALAKVNKLLSPGGQMLTFCAKGSVKRALKALGLMVENPPGPPGKREMTRCTKIAN